MNPLVGAILQAPHGFLCFVLACLLFAVVLPSAGQTDPTAPVESGDLILEVANLQNIGKGQLVILLFAEVKRVEIKGVEFVQREIVPVTGKQMTLTLRGVAHGEYAVAVFHDMDKDLEADTNLIGIPREDMAVSNNARGGPLGGPKWKAAKFAHQGPLTNLAVSMWQCYR
jgi:uncharacterized protein (DUF2141 family)